MAYLNVQSEIGPLKRALVHKPGQETQRYPHGDFLQAFHLRPTYSGFDLEKAQREHDDLVRVLRDHEVEVVELTDLVTEVIASSQEAKDSLVDTYLKDCRIEGEEFSGAARQYFEEASTSEQLTQRLFEGIRYGDTWLANPEQFPLATSAGWAFDPDTYLTGPLNTSFFVRDPMNVIGGGVTLNHMYWHDRNREVDLFEAITEHHPAFQGSPRWFDHNCSFHMEGGDLINIDEHTLAVGLSERTEAAAIDVLCQRLIPADCGTPVRSVYVFEVPQIGNRLHLDTYLARIDHDTFIVDPALAHASSVYRVTQSPSGTGLKVEALASSLPHILEEMAGISGIRLIQLDENPSSRIETEYANGAMGMLCLSPGNLCVCEENVLVNDVLDRVGMTLHPVSIQEMTVGFGGPASLCLPLHREGI